ncbi:MAG: hypothetical protein B6A08_07850 [Sorangiineae bacterium NIC37A_2]|nr:MAG: hypothetical protein B6A08_07850 [Sorangiineae bacterium NIC37A_2]
MRARGGAPARDRNLWTEPPISTKLVPTMHFDMAELSQPNRYKLLTALVVPRPIGWITSLDAEGRVNLAPYSFFNVLGNRPPIVALGPNRRPDGTIKDTARNIEQSGEFVANIVTVEAAPAMHATSADFPPEESEVETLGLELLPSLKVKAPRVAISPVHLECRYLQTVELGENRVLFGEVLLIHTPDDWIDPSNYRLLKDKLVAVGRLEGPGGYATTRDRLDLGSVPKPDEVRSRRGA